MVSGWLLPSPWLSRSSPSLTHKRTVHVHVRVTTIVNTEIIDFDDLYLRPLWCLAVVAFGIWMGSLRAPLRWMVRSWITSLMCLIQSCLFSMLDAWKRSAYWGLSPDLTPTGTGIPTEILVSLCVCVCRTSLNSPLVISYQLQPSVFKLHDWWSTRSMYVWENLTGQEDWENLKKKYQQYIQIKCQECVLQTCAEWLRAVLWGSSYSPWLRVWIPDLALNLKYKIENFTGVI